MPKSGITGAIAAAVMAVLAFSGASLAREGLGSRLDMERLGEIQTGAYFAGDRVRFTLAAYAEKFLMRFDGEPEIYVLYADHGSYGGRVLKYDSGGTAMQVSGWGAMTVYTDAQPSGLPAARTGDAEAPVLLPVSLAA
ncbi:MAG: DUF4908 domain-containing protein, partial [Alphaproteobacteria bacterium]|nr:DUF4908 domain-containing protein [Alphaproteobacteria bacterium]